MAMAMAVAMLGSGNGNECFGRCSRGRHDVGIRLSPRYAKLNLAHTNQIGIYLLSTAHHIALSTFEHMRCIERI
jgi:hypothetical protein